MLTGRRPFGGRSPDSVVKKHLESPRPSPRLWRSTLSKPIEQLVMKMMAIRPDDRHATARILRHEIELILREKGFLRARVKK
jgi:serine/threonine protein kinase